MRSFEILSSLFVVVSIAILLIAPELRRFLGVTLGLFAASLGFHLVFEGTHWQLIPLYAAGFLLVILALTGRGRPEWASIALGSICFLLVATTFVLSWLMPMFRFPKPSGPFAVGTRIFHLVEASRAEENGPSPSGKRELMIQAWYPAQPVWSNHRAVYQRRRELTGRASYRSVLKTNAYEDTVVRPGGPFPVVIYNPGWNGERTEGTYQMEELASHGFIIVAVDHTFFGGLVEFPDGHVADSRNAPNIGNFEHSSVAEQWALGGKYVRIEAEDDIFVLDQLAAMNQAPASPLFHQIDMSRVGVMGFSIGGAAAVQMASQDPRVKVVLNMDGWEFGDVAQRGLAKPMMVIYEDKRGVLPERPKDAGAPGASPSIAYMNWQFSLEDYANVTRTMREHGGFLLFVAGTHHVDFTDRSLFSPIHSWTGRGSLKPLRAHAIVNAYALAFFSHFLKGADEPLLQAAPGNPGSGATPFKEVEYQHFDGGSSSSNGVSQVANR
jgi:predicted dienelactone hydrolase